MTHTNCEGKKADDDHLGYVWRNRDKLDDMTEGGREKRGDKKATEL